MPDQTTDTTPAATTPPDVSQGTQQELCGDALNTALTNESTLEGQVADLQNQIDQLGERPKDVDPYGNSGPQAIGWDKQAQQLDAQLKSATTNLSNAKKNTASVYLKIANDSTARARLQGQSSLWASQAQSAQAAADMKNKQAALLDAYGAGKDQATIQKLQNDANAAAQRAGLYAQQTQTSATQADLSKARATQINELTPQLVQLDQARTQNYGAMAQASTVRATLYGAQAGLAGARAENLQTKSLRRCVVLEDRWGQKPIRSRASIGIGAQRS